MGAWSDAVTQSGKTGRTAALSLAVLSLLALAGCTTTVPEFIRNGCKVGPNYVPPATPISEKWIDEDEPRVRKGNPYIAAWWEAFDDPLLTDLIRQANAQNLTLRAAGLQILQARTQQTIALSELLPQAQTLSMQYLRGQLSKNGGSAAGTGAAFGASLSPLANLTPVASPATPINGVAPTGSGATNSGYIPGATETATGVGLVSGAGANRFFTNVALAGNLSWELDFWGLFRRNLEAADANLEQSAKNYDEAVVLLLANVATQYVEMRTLQKRLELARKNVALQEPLVKKLEIRYKEKAAASYPAYFQLKSNLENTRALIPPLEILLRQANNQLCVLLGIPVQDLLPRLGDGTISDPRDPSKRLLRIPRPKDDAIVLGIPAEFLLLRPDVQAAERQLRIQSAQVGIAEAEMLPHLGINGTIGLASNSFANLLGPNSWTGGIGPSLTWNILNYGRLLANVRLQNLQYQQFVATYQNAILNANQDAENSIVGYLKSLDQARHLKESADASVKQTEYLIKQFNEGFVPPGGDTASFTNQVFVAINFQVQQQDAAAQAEGNVALNLILLYRALGGGWQIRLGNEAANASPDCSDLPAATLLPPILGDPAAVRR